MKLSNVFYFKNIVDCYYPDENRPAADVQAVVSKVKEDIKKLPDEDFIEVIISCFIPDLYSGMGKCEKLFTKLTELMVGEWWRRMGGSYNLPTKKSGTEDVELIWTSISIVCDAKVFRLGRSQKAPNVKDFLKLASVRLWIDNLNDKYKRNKQVHTVIGGLVTYSSLHEWESDSEVYEECTNHATPVVMLPYEILALLLKYKERVQISQFIKLWNYSENCVKTSRRKDSYWSYISQVICKLLSLSADEYKAEIKQYHKEILLAAAEYRQIVQDTVDNVRDNISASLDKYSTLESLREYALHELERRDNAAGLDYLAHIDAFRSFRAED